jgi:hypothetical protein
MKKRPNTTKKSGEYWDFSRALGTVKLIYMLYISKYYRYIKNLNCSEVLGNETKANNIV